MWICGAIEGVTDGYAKFRIVHLLMRPLWIEQLLAEDERPPAISALRPSEEESGASTDSGDSVSVQAIVDFGGDGRQ